ncbi:MAG: hypothetical protein GXY82_08390 [Methanospirillum sp.]|nr:hypothetical protein [Methanospirillum sp.]
MVLKLAPDGSTVWTRVIDRGSDDTAEDLVELPDGGYAVTGGSSDARFAPPQPLLVRLSPDGAIVWDRPVTDGFDVANAVVPAGDGGTAVLTGNGTVVRLDPDGRMLWARATGIPEAHALDATADGGFIAGGRITYEVPVNRTDGPGTVARLPVITTEIGDAPVLAAAASRPTTPQLVEIPRRFDHVQRAMVVRLDADGGIAWERQYDDPDWLKSLADGPAGLIVAGYGDTINGRWGIAHPLLALRLLPDGTPAGVSQIDTTSVGDPVWIRPDGAGYRVLYQNTSRALTAEGFYLMNVVDAVLDRDGCVLEQRPIDGSIAVTWTTDGGYFSVGIPPVGNSSWYDTMTYNSAGATFHARRLDSAGRLVWDRVLPAGPLGRVTKVVQTTDGGYAVLAEKQNR